jgi:hypothetical protein
MWRLVAGASAFAMSRTAVSHRLIHFHIRRAFQSHSRHEHPTVDNGEQMSSSGQSAAGCARTLLGERGRRELGESGRHVILARRNMDDELDLAPGYQEESCTITDETRQAACATDTRTTGYTLRIKQDRRNCRTGVHLGFETQGSPEQ